MPIEGNNRHLYLINAISVLEKCLEKEKIFKDDFSFEKVLSTATNLVTSSLDSVLNDAALLEKLVSGEEQGGVWRLEHVIGGSGGEVLKYYKNSTDGTPYRHASIILMRCISEQKDQMLRNYDIGIAGYREVTIRKCIPRCTDVDLIATL